MRILQWAIQELNYYARKDAVEEERAGGKSRLVRWQLAMLKQIIQDQNMEKRS